MSLSKRLREAALERARRDGQRVDDYVLEPDGVIDLRALEREPEPPRPPALSQALADIRAREDDSDLGRAGEEPSAPRQDPSIDLSRPERPAVELPSLGLPGSRPTAGCPQCGGTGRRDLFDRFSQTEFYSCDSCTHMWQRKREQ